MRHVGAIIGTVLGVIFVLLAALYWLTPAGNLPSFMPGFQAGSAVIHFKHGLLALILGIGAFVYAWFASGSKKASS